MTRTAGAQIGCQRPSRFWGLGCPKIYHEAEDTLVPPASWWVCSGWWGIGRSFVSAGGSVVFLTPGPSPGRRVS
ncbi:hypothetical protein, partial [Thiolapillus sp.]|uniref:hypothetical protein n=1 Tax=Thiolapillus sp. TaxID=2017437 RepID=UPI003AF838B9